MIKTKEDIRNTKAVSGFECLPNRGSPERVHCFLLFLRFAIWFHHFSLPFLPCKSCHKPLSPWSLLNSWPPFSLIVVIWVFVCVCVCIYIPKYNLFSLYNVTCMYVFRADLTGIGKPISVLFPGKGYFSCSQNSLVACSSIFRAEASWAFCNPPGNPLVSLFKQCLNSHAERLYEHNFWHS